MTSQTPDAVNPPSPNTTKVQHEFFKRVLPKLGALARAVYLDDGDQVSELIRQGVDLNHAGPKLPSALAVAVGMGRLVMVDALLSAGADPNVHKGGLLMAACSDREVAIARSLLNAGANPNAAVSNGWTPLISATKARCSEAIVLVLEHGATINQADKTGRTALTYAAESGDDERVELLLGRSATVDVRTELGHTPLMLAAQNGHVDVVRRLCSAGADLNAASKEGSTAISLAASGGHIPVLAALLDAGAELNGKSEENWTPLGTASAEGRTHAVEWLLAKGADPSAVSLKSWRPLALAVFYGRTQVVQSLLAGGVDPNERDAQGRTALMWASWRQYRRCYDVLIAAGADRSIEAPGSRRGPRSAPPVPLLQRSWHRPHDPLLLRILPRLFLLFAARRVILGIRVAVGGMNRKHRNIAIQVVEKALRLIEMHAPHELARVREAFARILVAELPVFSAAYTPDLEWCLLNWDPKAKNPRTPSDVAVLFVHEATHARLMRLGFGYRPHERVRIERACGRAALRFSRRLPGGGGLRHVKDHLRGLAPDALSDGAFRERALESLKEHDASKWFIRLADWWFRRREKMDKTP